LVFNGSIFVVAVSKQITFQDLKGEQKELPLQRSNLVFGAAFLGSAGGRRYLPKWQMLTSSVIL
jgi:hypothetical protein